MNNSRFLHIILFILIGVFLCSCSEEKPLKINYSFKTSKDLTLDIIDFNKINFTNQPNLDLSFYTGSVAIQLDISNHKISSSYIVLGNDLINHHYRCYKLNY